MWHHFDGLPGNVLRQQWIRLLVQWIGNFFERPRNLALLSRLRIYVDYILMRTGLHTGSLHFGLLLSLCSFTTAFANVSHVFSQEALESFAITFDWSRPCPKDASRSEAAWQPSPTQPFVIVLCTNSFMNRPRQSWSSSPALSLSLVFQAVSVRSSDQIQWVRWTSPPNTRSLEERKIALLCSQCFTGTKSNLGSLCRARALALPALHTN